ncbi:MAG: hypothetical protein AAGD22_03010 [Verrucomicrobiota bacterium]
MQELRFSCPRCNRPLGCGPELAGKPGRCPTCGQAFFAPLSFVGGRVEGGQFYEPQPGERIPDFVDEGAFGAMEVDKALEEKRVLRERRKKIGRARQKGRWRRRFEKVAVILVVVVGLLLLAGYGWSTWNSRQSLPAELVEVRDVGSEEMAKTNDAREVVFSFLDSGTVEERLKWVRDVDRVEPLMREYYGRRGMEEEPYRRLMDPASAGAGWTFFDLAGLQFVLVEMENYTLKVLVLEFTEEGPKVDWESWVIYGEMEWTDFKAERPTIPVLMRPVVMESDYFNFGYSDSEKWACYRLTDPELGDGIFGYVARGSGIDKALEELIAQKGSAWPVLTLRWPEGGKSRQQVEIVELLSKRWVMD